MQLDMWYGNTLEEVTKVDVTFSDVDCEHRGNLFIGDKIVGDFSTQDSTEIERTFPNLVWGQ